MTKMQPAITDWLMRPLFASLVSCRLPHRPLAITCNSSRTGAIGLWPSPAAVRGVGQTARRWQAAQSMKLELGGTTVAWVSGHHREGREAQMGACAASEHRVSESRTHDRQLPNRPQPSQFGSFLSTPATVGDAPSPAATALPPTLTMSIPALRSCQRALPVRATGRSLASVRSLATDSQSSTPAAKPTEEKQIEHAPQRDIVAADLVSGAPSELRLTGPPQRLLMYDPHCS